jgi:hypothetical protein
MRKKLIKVYSMIYLVGIFMSANAVKAQTDSLLLQLINSNKVDSSLIQPPAKMLFTQRILWGTNGILKNRLFVVDVEGYGTLQKIEISKNILIPKKMREYGLENQLVFDDQVIEYIINKHRKTDRGVRELKRNIDTICKRLDILKTSLEPDGTYGVLDWTFKIENLRFPLKLTKKHIDVLLNDIRPTSKDNDNMFS